MLDMNAESKGETQGRCDINEKLEECMWCKEEIG